MSSKQEICNLALSNVGVSQWVANIDTDRSNEALVLRRWYDISVNFCLEDFDWNFARRRIALALLDITPPSIWTYVYAYPSDCAQPREIEVEGVRQPYHEQRIPYEVAAQSDVAGDYKVIYTDQADAVLVYTKRITDAGMFDAQFTIALSWLLAGNIAMPLAVKPQFAQQAIGNYNAMKMTATASHLNASEEGAEPPGETERARNG